jgi:hypothetical protein
MPLILHHMPITKIPFVLCSGDHSIASAINQQSPPAMSFSSPAHRQAFPFKPYVFKEFRSDAKHRQKRKTPEGVYTCWEINTSSGTTWDDTVPCCTPCGRFKAERGITPRLSKLKSNRDSVRAYQCDTFWQDSEPRKNNNVVSPAGSYEPIVASTQPTKRRKVSPAVSPLVYQATPSPVKKRASAPAAKEQKSTLPVTDSYEPLQGFCNDLQAGLKISSDELAEAAKEKQRLVGNWRRLQQQYEDQRLLHQQLVPELKQRLQEADDLRKADLAYVESFEAAARDTTEHLPVPQDVDEIPSYL